MKRYLAEALGTFALVFCGTGAIVINQESGGAIGHLGVSLSFGLIVLAMIFAFGNLSGAHLNPVVSLAFVVAKKFPLRYLLPYVISQLLGAVLASLLLHCLFPHNLLLGATLPAGSAIQSFVLEFIITFLLMLVIMQVAHGSKERGIHASWAIGATVFLAALFAGPISGGSMNPVRSYAPALLSAHFEHLWIYLTAPFGGALSAVFVWRLLGLRNKLR